MRRVGLVLAVGLLAALPVVAGELAGIVLPETAKIGDTTVKLNGMGLRKKFVVKVYVGALYLPEKSSDPAKILAADVPMRMVMHFIYKEVEAAKVTEGWSDGFANNSGAELPALKERLERFNSWWPAMKSGDEAMMTYVPGTGTTLEVNGKALGTIPGRDFARALQNVWVGPKPPDSNLKEGVLGL
jgi:hypothetical protein